MLIAIEGNIGAGKSTFSKTLSEQTGWHLMEEPVETNPYLELYYEDPKRWGTEMQQYLLGARFNHHLDAMEISREKHVILDRTLFGDRVFSNTNHEFGNIDDRGMQTLDLYWDAISKVVVQPDVFVYLRAKPETCKSRIQSRGRECEQDIPFDYLSALHKNYDLLWEVQNKSNHTSMMVNWENFHTEELIEDIKEEIKRLEVFFVEN